jgi:hypothetical protein
LPNLRSCKRFYWVDGSITVGVTLARIERQEHIPEQLWPVLILNRYDGVKVIYDLITKSKVK